MGLSDTHDLAGHRLIDAAKVASGFTGALVVFLTDAELFPLLAGAAEDGADIRVSADEAGAVELPRHVLAFSASGESGTLAVRVEGASDSADVPVYFWTGKTGAEAGPAASDPNGRDAVFADFAAAWTGYALTDLTGGGADYAMRGSAAAGADGGPLGQHFVIPAAASGNASGGDASGLSLDGAFTDLFVASKDNNSAPGTLGALDNGAGQDLTAATRVFRFLSYHVENTLESLAWDGGDAVRAKTADRFAAGTWGLAAHMRSGAGGLYSFNEGSADKGAATGATSAVLTHARLGRWHVSSGAAPPFGGRIAFRGILPAALTDAQVDTFAAALVSPSTFTKAPGAGSAAEIDGAADADISFVLQRDPVTNSAAVPLSGSYSGAEAGDLRVRYQPGGAAEIVANAAGGAWSHELSLPARRVLTRIEVSADAGASWREIAADILVGINVLGVGQSNIENWKNGQSDLPHVPENGRLVRRDSPSAVRAPGGFGNRAFVNVLAELVDLPVGFLNFGKGSAAFLKAHSHDVPADLFWWDHENGEAGASGYYDAAKAAVAAHGCELIVQFAGHGDSAAFASEQAEIPAALSSMLDALRGAAVARHPVAAGDIKAVIGEGLNWDEVTRPNVEAWRAAVRDHVAADTDSFGMGSALTLPFGDAAHAAANANGYGRAGELAALGAAANVYGVDVQWRGPALQSAVRVDAEHTDVRIAHAGGTDLAPASGITGFEVSGDGESWVGASGEKRDAGTIRLMHGDVENVAFVRYQHGEADVSGAAFDDNGFAVEPGLVTVAATDPPRVRTGRTRRVRREDRTREIGAG